MWAYFTVQQKYKNLPLKASLGTRLSNDIIKKEFANISEETFQMITFIFCEIREFAKLPWIIGWSKAKKLQIMAPTKRI